MRNDIIEQAIQLDHWRQNHNQKALGFGLDPYQPETPYDYAEAWSQWGRGYLGLYRLTRDRDYLEQAEHAANWLLTHPNPGYQHPSWGLPWRWEQWDTSADLSYLITTVLVGELLLDLYETTGKTEHLQAAQDVATWILEENGGEQSAEGRRLYYANHPGLTADIINPTAKASGFLASLYRATHQSQYKEASLETCAWVAQAQRRDGAWLYSTQNRTIDNVHTGFTLEGVWTVYRVFRQPAILRMAQRGMRFYQRHCFQPSGRGYEHALSSWYQLGQVPLKAWVRDRLAQGHLLPNRITETRAHGYASAMRAFAMAGQFDPKWWAQADRILDYVRENLALADGSLAYRLGDDRRFIRHQAHLFAALCCLAEALP